jgi:hypothetical protein
MVREGRGAHRARHGLPAPGQRQSLEERAAMLGGVRGRMISNPAQSLGASRGVTTDFISAAVGDVTAYNNPLHSFAVDVRNPTTGQAEQNVYLRLSAADTACITDVHGNGWAYVLSHASATKSAVNPHPQAGAWGQYSRGADGAPVATMNDL